MPSNALGIFDFLLHAASLFLLPLQTHKLAVDKGVAHARLPIDEFIKMKTRKVLTVDHVFSILASVTAGKSWRDSFLKVLPDRKGIEVKNCQNENAADAETCDKAEAEKCLEPTKVTATSKS